MNIENLKLFFYNIFSFDEKYPLQFTQFYFWVFFALVFALFSLIHSKKLLRNTFLLFASLFFYYKTCGLFVSLLLLSVLCGFFSGKMIYRSEKKSVKKVFATIGVSINLLVLCYFKYAYFFTDAYNSLFDKNLQIVNYFAIWANDLTGSHFDPSKILLPVGISFFTFQTISYIVDVYKRKTTPVDNILDFGFYVTFFPPLVAGPIVRANEFIPQLHKKFFLSKRQFGIALFWILNGLLKKIILSDYIALNFADRVFENPMLFTGFENLMALFAYSLQVYADFSGYTDIAIGVAMLMGFYLPVNFNSPYKAVNPGDFWKRWHISLSTWLKDYLYIPLGGNRKGKTRANINMMITMLLGGLWHGASWNFVIWGGLNGMGIWIHKIWKGMQNARRIWFSGTIFVLFIILNIIYPAPLFYIGTIWMGVILLGISIAFIYRTYFKKESISWLNKAWSIFLTFVFISFTRLFFRTGSNLDPSEANTTAWNTADSMIARIGGKWDTDTILPILYEYRIVFLIFAFGMIIHWLPLRYKKWYRLNFALLPIWVQWICVVVIVFTLYQFTSADLPPFIYFQF